MTIDELSSIVQEALQKKVDRAIKLIQAASKIAAANCKQFLEDYFKIKFKD